MTSVYLCCNIDKVCLMAATTLEVAEKSWIMTLTSGTATFRRVSQYVTEVCCDAVLVGYIEEYPTINCPNRL